MACPTTTPGATRADPRPIDTFPFAETIDVAAVSHEAEDPSPCVPAARSAWYLLRPLGAGILIVDLAGSTPNDAVVRLYRRLSEGKANTEFIGCASPIWNGRLVLETRVRHGEEILAQVGTAESGDGMIVVRAELRT